MNAVNSDKFVVPRRTTSESPPPPRLPPRPFLPPLDPPSSAARSFRGAAATTAIPIEADDESDLPPSYEVSTLPRPSDAHIHITVRSSSHPASNSAASLPSLMAGHRSSINTQGYLLTTPMSHDSSNHGRRHPRWDRWDSHHPVQRSGGCIGSNSDGCCFSSRGGCFFSDRDGCCFSDRGGCCFSDREGCCCSDDGGCCFSNDDGACCSDGAGCCCSRFEDERAPAMENNVRFA